MAFLYSQNVWNRPLSNDARYPRGLRPVFSLRTNPAARKDHPGPALDWRDNMIRLFNKWSIGDRSRVTKPIGPNELHMYPDNMKHTAKLPPRRDTVRKQFPISSVRLDDKVIAARHKEIYQRRREKEKIDRHSGS